MSTQSKLTPAEKLFLIRRRFGYNQARMAASQGVSRNRYSELELGAATAADLRGWAAPGRASKTERAVLMRRRANITQGELARVMGVCRHQVVLMEGDKANAKPLHDFWGI